MNLEQALLENRSKRHNHLIAAWAAIQPENMNELWQVIQDASHPQSDLAAWALYPIADEFPDILTPLLDTMTAHLLGNPSTPVKRSIARALSLCGFSDQFLGELVDKGFAAISNPSEAIAVRVHWMEIVYQITNREPDLKGELLLILQEFSPEESAAIRSRARKLTKKLEREMR